MPENVPVVVCVTAHFIATYSQYSSIENVWNRCRSKCFQVFKLCFPNADHLLCWIYIKDNVKRKLSDLQRRFVKRYIDEIFGEKSGNVKVKGLLHTKSQEEYESEWKCLEKIWLNREKVSDKFVSYLRKHKNAKLVRTNGLFCSKSKWTRRTSWWIWSESYWMHKLFSETFQRKLQNLIEGGHSAHP